MSQRNYLKISERYIELIGFTNIKNYITFYFYDSGIVITSEKTTNKHFCYSCKVTNNRKILDSGLPQYLRERRNIKEDDYFILVENAYYEIKPHKEIKS